MEKQEQLKAYLKKELTGLAAACHVLNVSYHKCAAIGIKQQYTEDELESFEALSSRFARASGILTQKVLRALYRVLQEQPLTFLDRANFAEKLGIVEDAKMLLTLRELRNDIAHEYTEQEVRSVFEQVLAATPQFLKMVGSVNHYCEIKVKNEE